MTETVWRRIDHPSAWTSAAIGGKEGLMHRLGAPHLDAIDELLAATRPLAPTAVTRRDWDHPAINALMTAVRYEIMNGRGAVILSGFDLRRISAEDFERIYWGLGTHLGQGAIQSAKQDRIGYVRKEEDNPARRGYMLDIELKSHTDFHELLGLACVSKAETGGESGLASSLAVHNLMLETRPDLLAPLYQGFYHQFGGDQPVSERKVPVFCEVDGKVSCYYHPMFLANAARRQGVALPDRLVEALKVFDGLAARPDVRAQFMLEPGEMMFWHNFVNLHSRAAFTDSSAHRRLLLRLWLNVAAGRPMDPDYNGRGALMDREHAAGRPALHYGAALENARPV